MRHSLVGVLAVLCGCAVSSGQTEQASPEGTSSLEIRLDIPERPKTIALELDFYESSATLNALFRLYIHTVHLRYLVHSAQQEKRCSIRYGQHNLSHWLTVLDDRITARLRFYSTLGHEGAELGEQQAIVRLRETARKNLPPVCTPAHIAADMQRIAQSAADYYSKHLQKRPHTDTSSWLFSSVGELDKLLLDSGYWKEY